MFSNDRYADNIDMMATDAYFRLDNFCQWGQSKLYTKIKLHKGQES